MTTRKKETKQKAPSEKEILMNEFTKAMFVEITKQFGPEDQPQLAELLLLKIYESAISSMHQAENQLQILEEGYLLKKGQLEERIQANKKIIATVETKIRKQ